MVDFKKDSWLYAIIAGALAIISIFTPSNGTAGMGTIAYQWFGEVIAFIEGEWYVGSSYGNGAGLFTLGIASFCGGVLLVYGINTWRGKEFRWAWLVYGLTGIAMVIVPILFWVSLTEPFMGEKVFGFAPLGVLMAGIIAIIALVLDRMSERG
jgi:hypothetical protein